MTDSFLLSFWNYFESRHSFNEEETGEGFGGRRKEGVGKGKLKGGGNV